MPRRVEPCLGLDTLGLTVRGEGDFGSRRIIKDTIVCRCRRRSRKCLERSRTGIGIGDDDDDDDEIKLKLKDIYVNRYMHVSSMR
mmetsp:Transcript_1285/g.1868  ORF Transcript_1285/g.1868 Transcript_1285/m.1868 type:complete len:85 (-) Transcript_1285:86-340(-)